MRRWSKGVKFGVEVMMDLPKREYCNVEMNTLRYLNLESAALA